MQVITQYVAMVSIQSMLKNLFFRIKLIEDGIGVGMVASSKDNDLEFLTDFPEKGESIGSNIDADLDGYIVDFDLDFEVSLNFQVFDAVDESFIEV